jgi:hypothetical protein
MPMVKNFDGQNVERKKRRMGQNIEGKKRRQEQKIKNIKWDKT